MTPAERENSDLINQSRRTHIAKGSGTNIAEVNKLMKQVDYFRKMMKQFSSLLAAAKVMRGMSKMPFGK
jgi:signal recognition particle subunit SRP54